MTLDDLLALDRRALSAQIAAGHPIDPDALADREFHGVSLAVPRIARPVAWQKFKKVFVAGPGGVTGYNEAVEQNGLDAPWITRTRFGRPVRYWRFALRDCRDTRVPRRWDRGLLIDYRPPARPWDPMRFMRDPLVAVHPGSTDLLLGVTYVDLGPLKVPTPTYFALIPGERLMTAA